MSLAGSGKGSRSVSQLAVDGERGLRGGSGGNEGFYYSLSVITALYEKKCNNNCILLFLKMKLCRIV